MAELADAYGLEPYSHWGVWVQIPPLTQRETAGWALAAGAGAASDPRKSDQIIPIYQKVRNHFKKKFQS